MLQRRIFLSVFGAFALAGAAWAQRVTQPIARPPRPVRPFLPGRFASTDNAAAGPMPGVYVVVAVDEDDETLQLRDQGGRTGLVHVNGDMVDLDALKPGDEVEVDFLVPEPGVTRFEAAGVWKVQR